MAYSHWDNFLINCTQMFGSIWFGLVLGESIAAAVLAALQATTIPANTVMVNHVPLQGSGIPADPMRHA